MGHSGGGGERPPETLADESGPERGAPPDRGRHSKLTPGTEVGRYVVLARVGAGGMGVVYSAYDPDLDRKVALKLLQPGELDGERTSLGHARLAREAKAMARLTHPNVATVHDVGSYGTRVFIAMEFVAGGTLRQWLSKPHPWAQVVELFVAAGRGLAAAHESDIVHRDFKPDNVLVGTDGRARVVDFGLARQIPGSLSADEEELLVPEQRSSGELDITDKLTLTGSLAGTPAYMAPEQHRHQPTDARTDQFSFALALWEALYGQRPFSGTNRASLAFAVCSGELEPPPSGAKVPLRVQRALTRALSVEPADRFASMNALLAQLQSEPGWARRPVVAAAGVLVVCGAVAAAFWPDQDVCDGGRARMGATWNRAARAAIEKSFAATDARFASSAVDRAMKQLDAYATQWREAYRESCEATHVRREQSEQALDLRTRCLSHRLEALDTTVVALQSADASAVRSAASAISRLPAVAECADVQELSLAVPLPTDPLVADAVEAARRRGAELSARAALGGYAEALEEAEHLHAASSEIDHAPLRAETAHLVGRIAQMAGKSERAEESLREAVFDAIAADHDRILAQAATSLVNVVGIELSRHEDATEWARHATAAVERLGEGSAEDGALAITLCKMLADKSDTTGALPHCHRAVELATARLGEGHLRTGDAHEALGIALYYSGDARAAQREFMLARDTFFAVKGPDHPDHAQMQNSLAAVCLALESAEACVGEFEKAVELSIAGMGPDHPMVADWRNNFADVLARVGRLSDARTHAQEALRIRRAVGEEHPGLAASLAVLGRVAVAENDLETAETLLVEALGVVRRTRGPTHRDMLRSYTQLGDLMVVRKDFTRAREYFEAALVVATAASSTAEEATALRTSLAALPPG